MARFEQRITSFDLEQLRRAYERHLNLFQVQALNRPEDRHTFVSALSPTEPYDKNPMFSEWSTPPSGFPGDNSGDTDSGDSAN